MIDDRQLVDLLYTLSNKTMKTKNCHNISQSAVGAPENGVLSLKGGVHRQV